MSKKRVRAVSEAPLKDRMEQLKALIPEAFTEGRVDFARLQAALGVEYDWGPTLKA